MTRADRKAINAKKARIVDRLKGYDGAQLEIGDQVELHPGCDLWMVGARYGVIRNLVYVEPGVWHLCVRMNNERVRKIQRFSVSTSGACDRLRNSNVSASQRELAQARLRDIDAGKLSND